jgi:hypothetical protein
LSEFIDKISKINNFELLEEKDAPFIISEIRKINKDFTTIV